MGHNFLKRGGGGYKMTNLPSGSPGKPMLSSIFPGAERWKADRNPSSRKILCWVLLIVFIKKKLENKYFIIEENGLPTKNETRENIKLIKFKGFKGSIKASTLA